MKTSDREDALGEWFEDHSIGGGWDLAPTFVQAGLAADWLDEVEALVAPDVLEGAWRIVVKKHHGDLRLVSAPGDTRFQIRLPLTPADPPPPDRPA